MKTIKIVVGSLLALLLLGILVTGILLWRVDLNDYKKEIEQLAAQQNVLLKIDGDLGWSFYPALGVRSGKLSILPPGEGLSAPVTFDYLNLSLQLIPLFRGEVVVNTVRLLGGNLVLQNKGSDDITRIEDLQLTADGLNLQQQPFALKLSLQMRSEKGAEVIQDIQLASRMQVVLDMQKSTADLQELILNINDTELRGHVQANFGAQPFYSVKLAGNRINLDRYMSSTASAGDGKNANDAGKAEAVIPAATVLAFPGDYDIAFQEIIVKHMTLSDMHLLMKITADGLMTIKPLQLHLYEGNFNLEGRVDVRPAVPQLQLKISLGSLQLEPALKDFLQVDKTFASGDLAFTAEVATSGVTTDDMIKALGGTFSFTSRSITLNQVDLTSSLDAGLLQLLQTKLPALMSADHRTVMTDLKGEGSIQQGVVKPAISAAALCTQFSGNGLYDVPGSMVDYRLGITFPSTDENKTCADINPRLKDIAWPVLCKGSISDDPAKLCRADMEKIQSILAKAAGKEAGQKLENKVDEALKKKFGEDAEQVKGLLKGLLQ